MRRPDLRRRPGASGRARRPQCAPRLGPGPGSPRGRRRHEARSAAARTASVLSAARGPGPRAHAAAARRRPGGGAALLRGPPLSPGDVIVHRREYLRFSCWTDCGNRHDARPQNDRYINEYDRRPSNLNNQRSARPMRWTLRRRRWISDSFSFSTHLGGQPRP